MSARLFRAATGPSTPVCTPEAKSIGDMLARRLFEAHGNHSEVHLTEPQLALLLKAAAQVAIGVNS